MMSTEPMQFKISQEDQQFLSALFPSEGAIHLESLDVLLKSLKRIPDTPGMYAFWWTGSKEGLEQLHRKARFQGKEDKKGKIQVGTKRYLQLDYCWQISEIPQCLYIGKTTNLRSRTKQHLELTPRYKTWEGNYLKHKAEGLEPKTLARALAAIERNTTPENSEYRNIVKHTTACQFRAGIELLLSHSEKNMEDVAKEICYAYFPMEPISYNAAKDGEAMIRRFFMEDLAIGIFKPWFNLDSER